jgi:hypothetical protein
MKAPTHNPKRVLSLAIAGTLAITVFLPGCSTPGGGGSVVVSTATVATVHRVGFLSDYDQLKPAPGLDGMLCWRADKADWKRYDKVQFERILVSLTPGKNQSVVDPGDLKTMVDYFRKALITAIQPETQVVDTAGPGVLQVRIALTDLVPTGTLDSVTGTLVPYAFVAEMASGPASGRPAGSTPYMGQTGIQVQFRDGASGAVLGECADTEIGRKYAADTSQGATGATTTWVNGYVDSFSSWSYAQDAFNKWAAEFAQRFKQLRGN